MSEAGRKIAESMIAELTPFVIKGTTPTDFR